MSANALGAARPSPSRTRRHETVMATLSVKVSIALLRAAHVRLTRSQLKARRRAGSRVTTFQPCRSAPRCGSASLRPIDASPSVTQPLPECRRPHRAAALARAVGAAPDHIPRCGQLRSHGGHGVRPRPRFRPGLRRGRLHPVARDRVARLWRVRSEPVLREAARAFRTGGDPDNARRSTGPSPTGRRAPHPGAIRCCGTLPR